MNLVFQTTSSLSIYPTYKTSNSRHPAASRRVLPCPAMSRRICHSRRLADGCLLPAPEMKDVLNKVHSPLSEMIKILIWRSWLAHAPPKVGVFGILGTSDKRRRWAVAMTNIMLGLRAWGDCWNDWKEQNGNKSVDKGSRCDRQESGWKYGKIDCQTFSGIDVSDVWSTMQEARNVASQGLIRNTRLRWFTIFAGFKCCFCTYCDCSHSLTIDAQERWPHR